jgi:hypothetical protein
LFQIVCADWRSLCRAFLASPTRQEVWMCPIAHLAATGLLQNWRIATEHSP